MCLLRDAVLRTCCRRAFGVSLVHMDDAAREKLTEIFRIVLEKAPGASMAAVRRVSEPRWDSLAHTSLIAAMETEFGLRLDAKDSERVSSFSAAELLLEERGVGRG